MRTLFTHIKELVIGNAQKVAGEAQNNLPAIKNAFLIVSGDKIEAYGPMDALPEASFQKTINCQDNLILPAFCDSHTHIVYAGNRAHELALKVQGLGYQEIAAKGGGILSTVQAVRDASEEELYQKSIERIKQVMAQGTGAIEIKSGYGLNLESELKMLRVARRIQAEIPLTVRTTFLAAHAIPPEFKGKKDKYLDEIVLNILPAVKEENLADYIDIFCEEGYFSVADLELILEAGDQCGLQGKVHVNQFNAIGGVKAAAKWQALTVDHLEQLTTKDIEALQMSNGTLPVALPGCSFYLGIPYTPARQLLDAQLPVVIATDYNPGSSPSGDMAFMLSLANIKMKLSPEEAINATTINGAAAMGLEATHGSLHEGKTASFIIAKSLNSYKEIPYSYGNSWVEQVWLNGKIV